MADLAFKSSLSVNDGVSNAQQAFPKAVMFAIPERNVKDRDVVTHDQADDYIGSEPGLKEKSRLKAEIEYTPAVMARLEALLGVRGKTFILGAPPALGTSTPPRQTFTFTGYVSKIGELKLGTQDDMILPFEVTSHAGFAGVIPS